MEIAPSLRSAGRVEVVRERKNKGTGKVHLENERRRRSLWLSGSFGAAEPRISSPAAAAA